MSNNSHTVMISLLGVGFAVAAAFSALLLDGVLKFTVAGLFVGSTITCAVLVGVRIGSKGR